MRGGGYNRVASINLIGQNDEIQAQMVMRVPRWGEQPDQDLANLQFVQDHLDVPTPDIIAYDRSSTNPLKSPYSLHSRIPGYDLQSKTQYYPSLSHPQKLIFVREFCHILLSMQKVQNPWIGRISKEEAGFTVNPFEVYPKDEELAAERAETLPFFKARPFGVDEVSKDQTPLRFFEIQFARWINQWMGADPSEM